MNRRAEVNVTIYLRSGQTIGPLGMAEEEAAHLSDWIVTPEADMRDTLHYDVDGGQLSLIRTDVAAVLRERTER